MAETIMEYEEEKDNGSVDAMQDGVQKLKSDAYQPIQRHQFEIVKQRIAGSFIADCRLFHKGLEKDGFWKSLANKLPIVGKFSDATKRERGNRRPTNDKCEFAFLPVPIELLPAANVDYTKIKHYFTDSITNKIANAIVKTCDDYYEGSIAFGLDDNDPLLNYIFALKYMAVEKQDDFRDPEKLRDVCNQLVIFDATNLGGMFKWTGLESFNQRSGRQDLFKVTISALHTRFTELNRHWRSKKIQDAVTAKECLDLIVHQLNQYVRDCVEVVPRLIGGPVKGLAKVKNNEDTYEATLKQYYEGKSFNPHICNATKLVRRLTKPPFHLNADGEEQKIAAYSALEGSEIEFAKVAPDAANDDFSYECTILGLKPLQPSMVKSSAHEKTKLNVTGPAEKKITESKKEIEKNTKKKHRISAFISSKHFLAKKGYIFGRQTTEQILNEKDESLVVLATQDTQDTREGETKIIDYLRAKDLVKFGSNAGLSKIFSAQFEYDVYKRNSSRVRLRVTPNEVLTLRLRVYRKIQELSLSLPYLEEMIGCLHRNQDLTAYLSGGSLKPSAQQVLDTFIALDKDIKLLGDYCSARNKSTTEGKDMDWKKRFVKIQETSSPWQRLFKKDDRLKRFQEVETNAKEAIEKINSLSMKEIEEDAKENAARIKNAARCLRTETQRNQAQYERELEKAARLDKAFEKSNEEKQELRKNRIQRRQAKKNEKINVNNGIDEILAKCSNFDFVDVDYELLGDEKGVDLANKETRRSDLFFVGIIGVIIVFLVANIIFSIYIYPGFSVAWAAGQLAFDVIVPVVINFILYPIIIIAGKVVASMISVLNTDIYMASKLKELKFTVNEDYVKANPGLDNHTPTSEERKMEEGDMTTGQYLIKTASSVANVV